MLNEMRFGQMSADTIARFRTLDRRPAPPEKGVTPTELFPLRADVERANMGRLEALKQEPRCFNARDGGEMPPEPRQKLLSNFMAPPSITLKVNAQVMLIKNTDDTLVNGSIGKVTGFMDVNEYKARVAAGEDLSRTNRDGSVMLAERKPEMMAMHAGAPEAAPGTKAPRSRSSSPAKSLGPLPKYPLVNFIVPGGIRAELVVPEIWKNELPNGEIQAQREQIVSACCRQPASRRC
jgi:ATP-dependent DNA helicase PIF1